MKRFFFLSSFALASISMQVQAQQDTLYLDAQQNVIKKKAKASSCALVHEEGKGKTTVYFYTVDGILTQSSVYNRFKKQASSRILHGETHCKFSNSTQDSLFVFYTNNRRNGAAIFYYPNGSVMAQGQYKDGMLNGLLQQFYPNGKTKRQEIYKDDVSQGGTYLSAEGTPLEFVPFYKRAEYADGINGLIQVISRNMKLSKGLMEYMVDNKLYKLTADIGIWIDNEGKVKGLYILRTDDPKFNEECFEQVLPVLKSQSFNPGMIDGKPAQTLFFIKDIMCSISPAGYTPKF